MVAATVANCHRGKRQKAFKPADFMPRPERKAQTVEDMLAACKAWAAQGGAGGPGV